MHPEAERIKAQFGDSVQVEQSGTGTVMVTHVTRWFFETKDPETKQALPESIIKNAADQCMGELERMQAVFKK